LEVGGNNKHDSTQIFVKEKGVEKRGQLGGGGHGNNKVNVA